MRDPLFDILFGLLLFGFLAVAILFILVRWLFRIDKIVAELMRIRRHLDRMNPENAGTDDDVESKCEICGKAVPLLSLRQLDSGHLVCKQCRNRMKDEGELKWRLSSPKN